MASLIICTRLHEISAFSSTDSSSLYHHRHYTTSALYALHLLTFDLDDTIFPITPVVSDANVAQLQTLVKFGYTNASNEQIIAASKQIRTELREAGNAITYSDLRKQSIRREIERLSGLDDSVVHDTVIETIFNAWLTERHASAERNLFPHTADALQAIREQYPDVVIGAITNGRGSPLEMPSIKEYFDFCISGEDEGVFPRRKPDKGIYEAAIQKYNNMQGLSSFTDIKWIHVGDDLSNDVGASALCGANAIWFTMESEKENDIPVWSTATQDELQKRKTMDLVAKEYVSIQISSLQQLPDAVAEVLKMSFRVIKQLIRYLTCQIYSYIFNLVSTDMTKKDKSITKSNEGINQEDSCQRCALFQDSL